MKGIELLGFTFRDRITGFEGIATGHVSYITGCDQLLLVPPVDGDGKVRDSQWFDTIDNSKFNGPDKEALITRDSLE